jgi:hypothetical protein
VQKQESFHCLPHHPRLLALYQTLFGGEVLVHARHIMRLVTPTYGDGSHAAPPRFSTDSRHFPILDVLVSLGLVPRNAARSPYCVAPTD